jgi:hypothetical protein
MDDGEEKTPEEMKDDDEAPTRWAFSTQRKPGGYGAFMTLKERSRQTLGGELLDNVWDGQRP